MKEIIRFTLVLFFICLVAASLLAGVNKVTKPKIVFQRQNQIKESLKIVMPGASEFKEDSAASMQYFKGIDDKGNLIGYCFKVQAQGYASTIETMVGLKEDGTITGIQILSQNETPGLGAKIVEVEQDKTILDIFKQKKENVQQPQRPWFQEQFNSKGVSDLDNLDAITGATISSEAVINSVKEGALKFLGEIKNDRKR